jgi:NNP family nitrate/nitrite transporter-like MFS transporter
VLKRNVRILAGGFAAFFSLNILNSSYSTVMALIKTDLGLSYTMSGALMSAYFIGYTMGQVPWGLIADRYGSRRAMSLSILGISISTVLFGFAGGFWHAAAARFLSGLLGAGVFIPGVRLVSGWFPAEARGTALGLLSVGGSLGLVTSSWFTPSAASALGWKGILRGYGLLGIASSAAIWMALRENPGGSGSSGLWEDLGDVVTRGNFWVLAVIQMIRLGANYVFIAWLPLLLQEEYGLSLVASGLAFSIFNIAGMVSNPAGGVASDRFGERRMLLVSFGFLAINAFAFTTFGPGPQVWLAVLSLGWFINFTRSPSFAVIPRLFGVDRAGKVSGMLNTFASFGAFLLPFLMGWVRDTTASYHTGWIVLSLLLGAVAVSTLLLRIPMENEP